MALSRRVWCSCTIIDYLQGTPRAKPCDDIIKQCERRELEILVSVLAVAEVAQTTKGDPDPALTIREFFSRHYVIPVNVDLLVAEEAQRLVREHGLKGADAIHLATAIVHRVPILETFDDKLIGVDGKEGNPAVTIRHPFYEGGQQVALGLPLDL